MADKELRAVLVGCGGMANAWMKNALEMPGLRLVGLVDINPTAARAMAEKYQLPAEVVFPTLKAALKKTKAEVVFDVTIPAAHDKVVIEALKAGCHVLGEKPMSDTLAKAKKMVATSKRARRTYAVTQNYRYTPQTASVSSFLRRGGVGRIEEVHADFFIGAHFGGFRDMMAHPLLLDMAIHTFDACRFLTGADPANVYCHAYNPKRSWYKGAASASAIFEMSNGLVFNYRGSWCAEGLNTPWGSHWRIVGDKGSLTWDGGDQVRCQTIKPGGKHAFVSEMQDINVPQLQLAHSGHAGVMSEFLGCIRNRRKPSTICDDNIKSLAMVFAAVESARTKKRVKVKW
ncbi:MAG: Gfo/Idh/MocA family oxidoreductase [Planctomycetes bacterium]|nr:Gfo/Idh/MocA family oxidoreductase [Planctomycetota bacterium]